MDEDISRLKITAVGLLNDLGCNGSALSEDLINELCRYGASELHAVAAFVGGVASQEVIKVCVSFISYLESCFSSKLTTLLDKYIRLCSTGLRSIMLCSLQLITRQFIPMSGTFIFNGIDHKSQLLLL